MCLVNYMLFEKEQQENILNNDQTNELEYKRKYGFLNELQSAVRTDEEYAKFKGYID